MKITNQSIPPEMAALFAELVTTTSTGPSAGTKAKTRRAARLKPLKPRTRTIYNDLETAVTILLKQLGHAPGTAIFKRLMTQEIRQIKAGTWNPDHWEKAIKLSSEFLSSTPISAPNPNPPPYAYRNINNLPSTPAYTSGSAAAGPARYSGTTSNGYFNDNLLVWEKTNYELPFTIQNLDNSPLLVDFYATVTAAGDQRGSRPMLSCLLSAYLSATNGPSLETTACPAVGVPVNKPTGSHGTQSFYWRYKPTPSPAPFYQSNKQRKMLRNLNKCSTVDAVPEINRAVILTSPRPMFGQGFNNNTSIQTTLTGTPDIYQLNPCAGKLSDTDITAVLTYLVPPRAGGVVHTEFIYTKKKWAIEYYRSVLAAHQAETAPIYYYLYIPSGNKYIASLAPPGDENPNLFTYLDQAVFGEPSYYPGPRSKVLFMGLTHAYLPMWSFNFTPVMARIQFDFPDCMPSHIP